MYLPEGQKTVADWTEVMTHRVNHLTLSFHVSGDLHVTFLVFNNPLCGCWTLQSPRVAGPLLYQLLPLQRFLHLRLLHPSSLSQLLGTRLPLYVHDIIFPNLRRAARKPFDVGLLRQHSPSVASCCSRSSKLISTPHPSHEQHETHEVPSSSRCGPRGYPQAGSDADRPRWRHGHGSTWRAWREAGSRRCGPFDCRRPSAAARQNPRCDSESNLQYQRSPSQHPTRQGQESRWRQPGAVQRPWMEGEQGGI